MKLRVGYELQYELPQPTPMILMLNVHYSRTGDLAAPDNIIVSPAVPIEGYRDGFGNWCSRIVAPAGSVRITTDTIVRDTGAPDPVAPRAAQIPVENLPEDALVFLLASRFCDSDRLLDLAWKLFGQKATGWARVQEICDFVHRHIEFGYHNARVTRSASEAYEDRVGVCRDYAASGDRLLAAPSIFRRATAPATSATSARPSRFHRAISQLGSRFFSAANGTCSIRETTTPRQGRVLIARGRDAADVAITTTFGPNVLKSFRVWTDEIHDIH